MHREHGNKVIGEVKIENTLGGMRYDPSTPPVCEPNANRDPEA